MVTDTKFAKTEVINGHKITRVRGGRTGSVMQDKTKYKRRDKHQESREW